MNDVYIDKEDTEITMRVNKMTILCGCDQTVVIDKMYGPLCANAIRVHLDYDSVCWIIERERITYPVKSIKKETGKNGMVWTYIDNDVITEWDEIARIDANAWEKRPWEDEE